MALFRTSFNLRPRGRRPLLLVFLLLTLGLSLWLGFQAVVAARSNRRIAEGVLGDYAGIAASEYARRTEEHLEYFFRDLFDEVPWRMRRSPPPPAEVVARQFNRTLQRLECRCEALRREAAFLAVDLRTGAVESIPETLPEALRNRAAEQVRARWAATPDERIAFFTAPAGQALDEATALAFNASLDAMTGDGSGRAIYFVMAPLRTVADLFGSWYDDRTLLPEAIAGSQPNDSLLHLAVYTPEGDPVFLSPRHDPGALVSRDTLPAEYGGLIVEVAVRPDAAPILVIGGLPGTRLPLLLALTLMTIGVGIAALLQFRKEEELARLRDDFISSVSHEFRTPLTQIRMFTELMADGKLRTEEDRRRSTAVINREARRLTHMVENILYFSRMGRAPVPRGTPERVVVREAIRDLTDAFGPLLEARGMSLEVTVQPPDARVLASRSGLYQMLANLLDNALKYGREGQTIRLEGEARNGNIRIAVEDQGAGIPVGDRDRVWEPYHRLQRDTDGKATGSGIGLFVVKRFAEAGGGSAWVEEGRTGGARFVVELPAAPEEV